MVKTVLELGVMNVGTRLKQQRIRANLDIKEVAHRVKKSYQYVWRIEEGINEPPTWPLLGDFARAYGTSVDYLLELTDNPRPASNDSLPEGAQQVIECMAEMSPRGRAELISICKSIKEVDQGWQQLEMTASMIEGLFGPGSIEKFRSELIEGTARLGSRDAALREILARIVADFSRNHSKEDFE